MGSLCLFYFFTLLFLFNIRIVVTLNVMTEVESHYIIGLYDIIFAAALLV